MNTSKPAPFDWIAFLVVLFLGVVALLLSAGIIYLLQMDKTPDAAYYTLVGAAIGALGSMLATGHGRQPQRQNDGAPVEVTTPPNEPLEVHNTETAPDIADLAAGGDAGLDEVPQDDPEPAVKSTRKKATR